MSICAMEIIFLEVNWCLTLFFPLFFPHVSVGAASTVSVTGSDVVVRLTLLVALLELEAGMNVDS